MHSLAAATLSEGLTARTSVLLFRISYHSSVVKVQHPRRDSDRRRLPMMRLFGRAVKPTVHRPGTGRAGVDIACFQAVVANGRRVPADPSNPFSAAISGPFPAAISGARTQIGLVSTRRMSAAPDSHASSPSSTDGVAPNTAVASP